MAKVTVIAKQTLSGSYGQVNAGSKIQLEEKDAKRLAERGVVDLVDDEDDTSNEEDNTQPKKATELIEEIKSATTVEEVNALIAEGETRSTVLAAAEKKKAELEAE